MISTRGNTHLILIPAIHVDAMILIKVCQLIVNNNGRIHVFGRREGELARPALVKAFVGLFDMTERIGIIELVVLNFELHYAV